MIRKLFIAVVAAVVLSLVLAIPVFADQPDTPGGFGLDVGATAQSDGGFSETIHFSQEIVDGMGITLGQGIVEYGLAPWGIPPRHAP